MPLNGCIAQNKVFVLFVAAAGERVAGFYLSHRTARCISSRVVLSAVPEDEKERSSEALDDIATKSPNSTLLLRVGLLTDASTILSQWTCFTVKCSVVG